MRARHGAPNAGQGPEALQAIERAVRSLVRPEAMPSGGQSQPRRQAERSRNLLHLVGDTSLEFALRVSVCGDDKIFDRRGLFGLDERRIERDTLEFALSVQCDM